MKYRLLILLVTLAGCQSAPETTLYKAWSLPQDRQLAYDQCKIESFQQIPQAMATEITPGYYNPGTVSCQTYGTSTSCNTIGAVNIAPSASTYDANQGLRTRFIAQCLAARGFTVLHKLPLCKTKAERLQVANSPQPADPSQLTCQSGDALAE